MGQFGSLSEFRMALDNIVASTSRGHRQNPGQMFDDEGPKRHRKRKKGRRRKKAGNNPRGARQLVGAAGFQAQDIISARLNRKGRKRLKSRKSRKNTGFVPEGAGSMQFVAPRQVSHSGDKSYKDPWARVGGSVGGTKKLIPGLTPDDKKEISRAARARKMGLLQHILEHLGFTKRDILRAHQWMENEGVLSYGEDRRLPDGTLLKASGRRDRKSQRRALEILMDVKQGKNNPRNRRRR